MKTLEELVAMVAANRGNVELLYEAGQDGVPYYGVRIRFYGAKLKGKMVLGSGGDFVDALEYAVGKAKEGRMENLDFAARPWNVAKQDTGGWG